MTLRIVKTGKDADREALKRAFVAFRPTLLCYLASRLGNKDDAHDIAQEAFLRLQRVKDPSLVEKPEGYFFQIVKNLAAEFLIKRGASIETMDLDTLMSFGGDSDGNLGTVQLEVRAAIVRLHAILEDLPPLYRSVLLLRKRDGYSHIEIAEQLGISKHTVHIYLTRALSRCREEWEKA